MRQLQSRRFWVIATLAVAFVFGSAAPSWALDLGTMGVSNNTQNQRMMVSGTIGRAWVYPSPTLSSTGQKVSSIYAVRALDGSGVEAGVEWDYLHSNARAFWARTDEYGGYFSNVTGSVAASQWLPLQVERTPNTTDWRYWVNGTLVHTETNTDMTGGVYSYVGAERTDSSTSGLGSWTYVEHKRYSDSTWDYWYRAAQDANNDSVSFHGEHVQDSNHWVYVQ